MLKIGITSEARGADNSYDNRLSLDIRLTYRPNKEDYTKLTDAIQTVEEVFIKYAPKKEAK